MHVVKPLAIDPNPLVNLGVPYYITEYLQNGTLKLFVQRTRQAGERLPNRLLWRLFLCSKYLNIPSLSRIILTSL